MIKHILKQIWTQRTSNIWLWTELFLVSVFLWFVVDYLYVAASNYFTPTGFNIEHTYKVSIEQLSLESAEYMPVDNKTTLGEDYLKIINRIRNYHGVEAVSLSTYSHPYALGNIFNNYAHDTTLVSLQIRNVTPDFFRVFRVTNPDGNTEPLIAGLKQDKSIVITKDAELKLMGEGCSAIGITLTKPEVDSIGEKVTGVSTNLRYTEFEKENSSVFILQKESDIVEQNDPGFFKTLELCIRVSPDADHDFISCFRKDMTHQLRVGNFFMLDIQSLQSIRNTFFRMTGDFNTLKTHLAIVAFLLVNIFLGIIGTFWFRTAYRKGEMGLRLALGSTRSNLRGLLIAEGLILLTLAIIPAAVVGFNIGHAELVEVKRMDFTFLRFLIGIVATYLLMIGMIILGIGYPARQAMSIQPAEVLHEQ